jgi:hypothetical protein
VARQTFTMQLTFDLNVDVPEGVDPQIFGQALAKDAHQNLRSAYRSHDPDNPQYFNAGLARVISSKVEDEERFL